MFGEKCLAFSGRIGDLIAFAHALGRYASATEHEDLMSDLRTDQFGMDHIAYAPGWTFATSDEPAA